MAIPNEDKERIYKQFRVSVGAPLRNIEMTDDMLCTLLEMSIEDYAQYVQDWLIEHQWHSLLGKNIDTNDMAFAMSVRDIDLSQQYAYAYSKQTGLQQRGPWELKKDYVTIETGKQVYQIPAGREINQILWVTPPTTQMALFANYAGIDYGFGGGFGQIGTGAGSGGYGAGGTGGYYSTPAYDVLLTAGDLNLKNRLLRSELVHKVTAGPNGTRLLHLISTPGSKLSFGHSVGGVGAGGGSSSINIAGCQVWYHYYDTTPENVDECRLDNPDIIKLPNEVPLSKLDFSTFNEPTKILVRQLFVALAKTTLGRTRGKFGGIVGPPNAERTMDFESLLSEGNEERIALLERLDLKLERLSSTKQIERAADESENLNRHLKHIPMGWYVK
tara:strand:+ start:7000 stop:8160 length:1161 start_codon:yes stop_codon:yes gene_type:complete